MDKMILVFHKRSIPSSRSGSCRSCWWISLRQLRRNCEEEASLSNDHQHLLRWLKLVIIGLYSLDKTSYPFASGRKISVSASNSCRLMCTPTAGLPMEASRTHQGERFRLLSSDQDGLRKHTMTSYRRFTHGFAVTAVELQPSVLLILGGFALEDR